METSTLNAGTHTGTCTEIIGTLSKNDLRFLAVALSTDKTRDSLTVGQIRYSAKCASIICGTSDTHRMHVVCIGNHYMLDNCRGDIQIAIDINSALKTCTAFKVDEIVISATVTNAGEFLKIDVTARGVDQIPNIMPLVQNMPNFERVIPDVWGIEHQGLKGAFNPAYIADACKYICDTGKNDGAPRVKFWQNETLRPAIVFDNRAITGNCLIDPGRRFAIIMPMQDI